MKGTQAPAASSPQQRAVVTLMLYSITIPTAMPGFPSLGADFWVG